MPGAPGPRQDPPTGRGDPLVGRGDPRVELVETMRRLRAECAWKAAQTHRSLARYLLEEVHETLEALDLGDTELLREELGDLLLQVVFHAAIAEQAGDFTFDDVATDLVAKLVRRNPHVFAADRDPGGAPADAAQVNELWESVKAVEKQRTSVTEGLPPGLPALLHADKVLDRLARRDGVAVRELLRADEPPRSGGSGDVGDRLLGLVAEAHDDGVDPEQALREACRRLLDARGRAADREA